MHISTIFQQEAGFPMLGLPTNPAKFEKALKELHGTLNILENMFLKRQAFLCSDDISLADLLAVCELMQVRAAKHAVKLIAYSGCSVSINFEKNVNSCTACKNINRHISPFDCLFQPMCGGRDVLKDRPKLLSWRSRVQSALSDSFDEAHSVSIK